jgi:hypothetical protein
MISQWCVNLEAVSLGVRIGQPPASVNDSGQSESRHSAPATAETAVSSPPFEPIRLTAKVIVVAKGINRLDAFNADDLRSLEMLASNGTGYALAVAKFTETQHVALPIWAVRRCPR